MINYGDVANKSINKHNLNWLDYPYRMIMIGGTRSGKTNALLNLIKKQEDDDYSIIDKICLCAKDPFEAKYQYFIKKVKLMVLKI